MSIAHCGRDVPTVKSSVLLSSHVLNSFSFEPAVVCCDGRNAEFIKPFYKTQSLGQNRKARTQFLPPLG